MSNCPRCGQIVRQVSDTFFCKCGWTDSKNQEKNSEKAIIKTLLLTFLLLSVSLFHFFKWGPHGLIVFFANAEKKAKICEKLKKYDCVETNYTKLFNTTGQVHFLEQLGKLQFKRKRFYEAEKTYETYFKNQGKDYKAAYYYAHALAKVGKIDSAIEYFDSILQSKPKVLMVTVMDSYLNILVSNNRIQKAKELLTWVDKTNKEAINTKEQIQNWKKKFNI